MILGADLAAGSATGTTQATLGTGLTGGIDARPVSIVGSVFFQSGFTISLSVGQSMTLSEFANGTGNTFVDDVLSIKVKHDDGSVSTYTHDYSNGCTVLTSFPPTNITGFFQTGSNKVVAVFKDKCGGNSSASPVFIVRQ